MDSNSRPSHYETLPLTTRPGLQCLYMAIASKDWKRFKRTSKPVIVFLGLFCFPPRDDLILDPTDILIMHLGIFVLLR